MNAGYVIHVGHYAPQKVIVAVPNKSGEPSTNVAEAYKTVGVHLLINRARVWARRVGSDGKPAVDARGEEQVLEVTDNRYRGRLEFLEWGTSKTGAQAIDIRYLPQSMSLDVEYQDNVQKIQVDKEGKDGSAFIELNAGENKFDVKTNELFISYLKVHPQNKGSRSKNTDPKIKGFTFYEITDEMIDKSSIKQDEAVFTAGGFVMGISSKSGYLKNLLEIFLSKEIDFGDTNMLSVETDIYKALINFTKTSPGDFAFHVNDYKKSISDCFEKAKSYNALDVTKAGFIAMVIDNKRDVVFEDAVGKGDEMLDWVLENFLAPAVYERTKHLKMLCEKLK